MTVDVVISVTVAVVIAGARESHEEQNVSPTIGSAATALTHFGEPHIGDIHGPALAMPTSTLAPKQSTQDIMLQTVLEHKDRNVQWEMGPNERRQ